MALRDKLSPTGRLPWPDDSPEGLAARWLRWLASDTTDPVRDPTGQLAYRNQPADVFFLAGTYGGAVTRECSVPVGRPLFFPVVNTWANIGSIRARKPSAWAAVDGVDHPVVEIITGRSFAVAGPWGNPVNGMRWPTQMKIWGLWSHVPPLPPGRHLIQFQGQDGNFGVAATYHLTVG